MEQDYLSERQKLILRRLQIRKMDKYDKQITSERYYEEFQVPRKQSDLEKRMNDLSDVYDQIETIDL